MDESSAPAAVPVSSAEWADILAPLRPHSLRVFFDLSNKCNIRCRQCYFSYDSFYFARPVFLKPDVFERVAEQVLPYARTVLLSAGTEPLTSPYFLDILAIVARFAPPEVLFLTNGLLLKPRIADALVEHQLSAVHFSTDGATRETYEAIRRGGNFDTFCRNIAYLAERKRLRQSALPKLVFNLTLMKSNLDELEAFVDLAQQLGVSEIGGRHVAVFEGLGMENESLVHDKQRANERFHAMLEKAARAGIAVTNFPDYFRIDGQPWTTPAPQPSLASDDQAAPGRISLPLVGGAGSTPLRSIDQSEPANAATSAGRSPDALSRLFRGFFRRANQWFRKPIRRDAVRPNRHQAELLSRTQPEQPRPRTPSPFGYVDCPTESVVHVAQSARFSGWALDALGVSRVELRRTPLTGDQPVEIGPDGLVSVGEARFHNGARPDVAALYPGLPQSYRAAWTFDFTLPRQAAPDPGPVEVHVLAENHAGARTELGWRIVHFDSTQASRPHLFCPYAFNSVYINYNADLFPYPDCHMAALTSFQEDISFEQAWHGPEFTDLRRRIIEQDPPDMCRRCTIFLNRRVEDGEMFVERQVTGSSDLPTGCVDHPADQSECATAELEFSGWAVGFVAVERVEISRDPADAFEAVDADGRVHVGDAWFSEGTRPDIVALYGHYPNSHRSGWTFRLRRDQLPADGPFRFSVTAVNARGKTLLGTRTVSFIGPKC
jgi:MoaA/NifB/PqqE/SkfB family radical SAM enzyme